MNSLQPLFAHHDMPDSFDFLGLHPVTPLDHAFAFAIYATLIFSVFLGLRWAARINWRRVLNARTPTDTNASPIGATRTLEG